MIVEADLWC